MEHTIQGYTITLTNETLKVQSPKQGPVFESDLIKHEGYEDEALNWYNNPFENQPQHLYDLLHDVFTEKMDCGLEFNLVWEPDLWNKTSQKIPALFIKGEIPWFCQKTLLLYIVMRTEAWDSEDDDSPLDVVKVPQPDGRTYYMELGMKGVFVQDPEKPKGILDQIGTLKEVSAKEKADWYYDRKRYQIQMF
jgi:hypothetical protein